MTGRVNTPVGWVAAWLMLATSSLLILGCSGSDDSKPVDLSESSVVPERPADCAGESGGSMEEIRLAQWSFARERLHDDPSAQVWLGFARTLSPREAGDALEPLDAQGVLLVYEQRQGTYAKVQQRFAAVGVDDAALEQSAKGALSTSVNMDNPLGVPSPDAFAPLDEGIGTTVIPIAALLVSGDIGSAIARDECLIYSLSVEEADAPPVAPAIEPAAEPRDQHDRRVGAASP